VKTKLWKYPYNEEKTEEWLNELAGNGLICVGADTLMSRYTFEQGEPGEYIYRYVFFENCFGHSKSLRYFAFLRESGIECVGHAFQHVLLRKKAADGEFNLFTDRESKIRYYKRIIATDKIPGIVFMLGLIPFWLSRMAVAHMNIADESMNVAFNSHFHPIVVVTYLLILINAAIGVSYFRQWRHYVSRVKTLKSAGALYE